MNPSKRDRWPDYEQTRHVLIMRTHRFERPWQGYVVDWKRTGSKTVALVVYMDETMEGKPVIWRWIPAQKLRPIHVDPNPPVDEWF